MKIAVYGDSFGNSMLENLDNDNVDRGLAWVELLEQKYEVVNFAESGSSLIYSYDLFLKNNKDFDYNIFLVTEPNRITLPSHANVFDIKHVNFSALSTFRENRFRKDVNEQKIIDNITQAIWGYYSYIHDNNYSDIIHKLMVDNILNINKNTLLIPCFHNSKVDNADPIIKIAHFEMSKSNIHNVLSSNNIKLCKIIEDGQLKWFYNDYRKCHITEENNKILFDYIDNAIINNQNKLNLNINDFKYATKDYEFYFFKSIINDNALPTVSRLNGELHSLYNKFLIDRN